MYRYCLFLTACWLLLCQQSQADFQSKSLSLLYGERYLVDYYPDSDDQRRFLLTFEHAGAYSWGDSFVFIDAILSSENNRSIYAEFSPRLSLAKLGIISLPEQWLISDLSLASTIEASHFDSSRSDNEYINFLYGIGLNWKLPGFRFFQTNVYRAKNEDSKDDWQLTLAWAYPFQLSSVFFLYDGFVDWSSATSDHHTSMNWTSQLKWDAGRYWWNKPNTFYLGIEYVYWEDKFSINHETASFASNERNINLLIKTFF